MQRMAFRCSPRTVRQTNASRTIPQWAAEVTLWQAVYTAAVANNSSAIGKATMRVPLQLSLVLVLLSFSQAKADRALFENLCRTSQCSGSFARLEIFQDSAQRLAKIRFRGDFSRCSHTPAIYFDNEGRWLADVDDWLRTGERLAYAEQLHKEQTMGLVRSSEIACSEFFPN